MLTLTYKERNAFPVVLVYDWKWWAQSTNSRRMPCTFLLRVLNINISEKQVAERWPLSKYTEEVVKCVSNIENKLHIAKGLTTYSYRSVRQTNSR